MVKRKSLGDLNCSWCRAADVIGDHWSIVIVYTAFRGARTFSDFANTIPISRNILTQRLNHLVAHGVMTRRRVKDGSFWSLYELTKMGEALFPAFVAQGQWGDEWLFEEGKQPAIVIEKERCEPVARVEVRSTAMRPLDSASVRFEPRSGTDEVPSDGTSAGAG